MRNVRTSYFVIALGVVLELAVQCASAAPFRAELVPIAVADPEGYSAVAVRVAKGRAYLARKTGGVFIYDVSTPSAPRRIGHFDVGVSDDLEVLGDHVLVATTGSTGLHMVDVRNPASPVTVRDFYYVRASSVHASGGYACAVGGGYLTVVDVRDASSPQVLGRASVEADNATGVFIQGNYAYVGCWSEGVKVFDLQDPMSPRMVGVANTSLGTREVCVAGNWAFTGEANYRSYGLRAVNISQPDKPAFSPSLVATTSYPLGIRIANGLAYVTDWDLGGGRGAVRVMDVGNPLEMREVGSAWCDDDANDLAVEGQYLYVAQDGKGLKIFRIDYKEGVAPSFTKQPRTAQLTAGQVAEFDAFATGDPFPNISWQASLDGGLSWTTVCPSETYDVATTGCLKVKSTMSMRGTSFRAVAQSASGVTPSATASLSVSGIPVAGLSSQVVGYGENVELKVVTLGAEPFKYQWYLDGCPLAGQTGAALRLTNVNRLAEGSYTVKVSNEYGEALSNPASLRIRNLIAWSSWDRPQKTVPTNVFTAVALAASGSHNLALMKDGTVAAWGDSQSGQCDIPSGLPSIRAVAAGKDFSLALAANGRVVGWPTGNGVVSRIPAGLDNVIGISAGADWALAVQSNGQVVAWGTNILGATTLPASLNGVISAACGLPFGIALRTNGTVVTWGGAYAPDALRVPTGLSNVVAVAAGWLHCLALRADGTVVAWGDDDYGQSSVPLGVSNVVSIACGAVSSVAVLKDGTLRVWGLNGLSQPPPGTANVVLAAAGEYHGIALLGSAAELSRKLAIRAENGFCMIDVSTRDSETYSIEAIDDLRSDAWKRVGELRGYGFGTLRSFGEKASQARFYRARVSSLTTDAKH